MSNWECLPEAEFFTCNRLGLDNRPKPHMNYVHEVQYIKKQP